MKTLKIQLFDVLSGEQSVEEFEQYVYTDATLMEAMDEDEFVFDLVSMSYKQKDVLQEIEKLTFDRYDYEEYLIYLLEVNCAKILLSVDLIELGNIVAKLCEEYDWDSEYEIFSGFYYWDDEMYLVEEGHFTERELIQDLHSLSDNVLIMLKGQSLEDKKILLKKPLTRPMNTESETTSDSMVSVPNINPEVIKPGKRWFEFWK